MTRKLRKTSGQIKETNYRHHIEPRVQFFGMQHKKNGLMTIGMSTETEICRIRGLVSRDSHN